MKLYFILLVLRDVSFTEITCMLKTNSERNPYNLCFLSFLFLTWCLCPIFRIVMTMQELSVRE